MEHRAAGGRAAAGRSMFGPFLLIIAGIFGVLLVLRLIGGLFNRSAGQGYPGRRHGNARPWNGRWTRLLRRWGLWGPGGFMSGILGGLGGALAGNWLYDQFSGRHGGQYGSADMGHGSDATGSADPGGDAIIGADDDPGGGASWDPPAGDAGGGGGDWAPVVIGVAAAATGAVVAVTGRRRRRLVRHARLRHAAFNR